MPKKKIDNLDQPEDSFENEEAPALPEEAFADWDTSGLSQEDLKIIKREAGFIAADAIWATNRGQIHRNGARAHFTVINNALSTSPEQGLYIQMPIPWLSNEEDGVGLVTEIVRQIFGNEAANLMHLIYQIANDPPYWRTPTIRLSVNEVLDRLGKKRDRNGYHHAENRLWLKKTLLAFASVPISAGRLVRRKGNERKYESFVAPLISVATSFTIKDEQGEGSALEQAPNLAQLWKGNSLPGDEITVSINRPWYMGVRGEDGRLGTDYVLLPRLEESKPKKGNYNYTRVADALTDYLYLRHRELGGHKFDLPLTRQIIMEKGGITDKNVTQANKTLRKALTTLQERKVILTFSPEGLPTKAAEIIILSLNPDKFKTKA